MRSSEEAGAPAEAEAAAGGGADPAEGLSNGESTERREAAVGDASALQLLIFEVRAALRWPRGHDAM